MPPDKYANYAKGLESPAEHAFSITPSDSEDLDHVTRGLFLGANGDVKVTTLGGDTVTFAGMAIGVFHAIRVKRVWATDTTATDIMGVY